MKPIKPFSIDSIPQWKIVIAATSDIDYSMDRILLVGDHPEYGEWTLVDGGHCSCYGFDETDWDATVCTTEELLKVVTSWQEHGYGAELIAAPLILRYLGTD